MKFVFSILLILLSFVCSYAQDRQVYNIIGQRSIVDYGNDQKMVTKWQNAYGYIVFDDANDKILLQNTELSIIERTGTEKGEKDFEGYEMVEFIDLLVQDEFEQKAKMRIAAYQNVLIVSTTLGESRTIEYKAVPQQK